MKKNNIKAVLNCTEDIPNYFVNKHVNSIEYYRIPIDDSLKEKDLKKLYYYLPGGIEFLYKHVVLHKNPVYVHCWAGRQRSAVLVSAFLVYMGYSPEDAIKFVLQQRPEAFHFGLSFNFEKPFNKYCKYMKKYYKKCGKLPLY